MTRPSKLVLAGVALVALSTLLFEVLLTRIFAVTMWYHFGFLAISLAMMGTAAAAVMCYLFPERLCGERYLRNMRWSAGAFGFLALIAIYVHLNVRLPGYAGTSFYLLFGLQLTLLFAAFFASGLCITISLFYFSKHIGRVYFFDLCGAALGSFLVVPLLFVLNGLSLVFFVAAIALGSAALFGRSDGAARFTIGAAVFAVVLLIGGLTNERLGILEIGQVKSYQTVGEKHLQNKERHKVYEEWSPVSRVAVFAPSMLYGRERMIVTADAGAPTSLWKFDGNIETLRLDEDCRQVAQLFKQGSVAIVGSAGGSDIRASLKYGQKKISAVDINPVTAKLVTEVYADYIGNIFSHPKVSLTVQDGRNFIASSDERYDLIQLTMIDSWAGAAAGAYLFNENSLYTVEAIRDYYDHLEEGGVLSITRYLPWNEAYRLTNMYIEMLSQRGMRDAGARMVILAEPVQNYRRATMLLKKGAFTQDDIAKVFAMREQCKGDVLWAPLTPPEKLSRHPYAALLKELVKSSSDPELRDKLIYGYPADVTPSTDDRPFFFFTTRLSDVFNPPRGDHPARRLAMPILYGMLGAFALLCLITVILPLYVRKRAEIRDAPHRKKSLLYFAMLGAGFMLVEISLIQRLTVFLGHPIWSFVVVLSTLLFAGGLGSFWSERWKSDRERVLSIVLACVLGVVLLYYGVLYDQFITLMSVGKVGRFVLAVLAVLPLGFLLGCCFPLGMQIIQEFHRGLVPWGWGVNGVFSVFASILSLVIAINLGFKASLALGAACYAIALLVIVRLGNADATGAASSEAEPKNARPAETEGDA